jgi:hypothetical protein
MPQSLIVPRVAVAAVNRNANVSACDITGAVGWGSTRAHLYEAPAAVQFNSRAAQLASIDTVEAVLECYVAQPLVQIVNGS